MNSPLKPRISVALAALLLTCGMAGFLLSAAPAARADQVGDMLAAAMTKLAPSIVSIRVVSGLTVQAKGQSQEKDVPSVLKGVVVSPDGLVMCSSAYFSGDRMKNAMGLSDDSTAVNITLVPKEIRITVGSEASEYYGSLVVSDSSLGLSFIQIRDLNGRTLPYIDLSAAPSNPNIGDPTASVTRLGKANDFAPVAIEDRISGMITEPRKGYIPEGYASSLGLPVYGPDGNIVGVVTVLNPEDESPEDQQAEFMAKLYDDVLTLSHTQYILPASVVAPIVAEAKTMAAALPSFVAPKPKTAPPATPPASPATTAKPAAA